jgi:hypothetical protein
MELAPLDEDEDDDAEEDPLPALRRPVREGAKKSPTLERRLATLEQRRRLKTDDDQ